MLFFGRCRKLQGLSIEPQCAKEGCLNWKVIYLRGRVHQVV